MVNSQSMLILSGHENRSWSIIKAMTFYHYTELNRKKDTIDTSQVCHELFQCTVCRSE